MKRHSILFAILGIFLLLSFASDPPNGRTGAPGESTCASAGCHSNQSSDIDGTINLLGLPDTIRAGESYSLTLQLTATSGDPERAGFQMVALDNNEDNAGILSNPGASSAVETENGRTYFDHRPAEGFTNDARSYTVDWVAPSNSALENVSFYAAGIFSNGDGTRDNDKIITTSFTFPLGVAPVDADNDGFNSDVDCDDNNADINPDAMEIPDNGIDEDCVDGDLVTIIDNDNDGFNSDVDCNDNNPDVNPGAMEIPDNGISLMT